MTHEEYKELTREIRNVERERESRPGRIDWDNCDQRSSESVARERIAKDKSRPR